MSENTKNLSHNEQTGAIGKRLLQSTLHGFFWAFLGTGAQAILQLLVLIILARLITPLDFGLVSAALIIVQFTSIFSQLGVGPAVVQRPALEDRHVRTAFTLSILFGIGLTGLIWAFAPAIAHFFRINGLIPVVQVMSLVFLLQGPSIVAESLLQRELQFRWLAGIDVAAFTVGFGMVGVVLACLDFGVWALVGAHLTQIFVKTVILLITQSHPKRLLLERRALLDLLHFGGGFTLARTANYLGGEGDNIIVGRWLGAEALGLYGRAYQLMVAPAVLFGQVLDKVLFPAMAKIQQDPERLATVYRRGVSLIALVILPTSIILFLLAPELIYVLLGTGWDQAVIPFQILALGMLFRTSYKISDSISRATGAVYHRAWRQGIYALLVFGGAYFGQQWGLAGVSLGVLCAITINFILMAQLSLKLAGITWKNFVVVHLPALALTLIVGSEVELFASAFRYWHYSPVLVLMISAMSGLATILLLILYMPKLFLGKDGLWLLQTLSSYLPLKINTFVNSYEVSK